jgi:restriction endonuclease Mrr
LVHTACAFRWFTKQENDIMQTVLRRYSGKGAKELFDVLEKHAADVEELMRTVKGFVGYTLARSGDGGFSVTVCNDKAGVDESVQKAKDWIAKNAGSTGASAPEVSAGSVILHVK